VYFLGGKLDLRLSCSFIPSVERKDLKEGTAICHVMLLYRARKAVCIGGISRQDKRVTFYI
jgi:hypothetical protein